MDPGVALNHTPAKMVQFTILLLVATLVSLTSAQDCPSGYGTGSDFHCYRALGMKPQVFLILTH